MTIDTQADIHAHELDRQAFLEDQRDEATHEAVATLWSNPNGVAIGCGLYVNSEHVVFRADTDDEPEYIRRMMNGDSSDLQDLYNQVAYDMLYPYADFLISNNSQPF